MADQASVRATKPGSEDNGNTNGSPEKQVVGGIAEFGNDIATLVELQAKLAMADLKESVERALVPMVLIVLGLLFLFGALPVLLFGAAELVASALKIRIGWALLLTSGVTFLVAGTVVAVSARRLPASFSSFRRSREEFARNLAWIRTVLLYSGRSLPRRYR
jgi:uncharacterized membrane protein YqjE